MRHDHENALSIGLDEDSIHRERVSDVEHFFEHSRFKHTKRRHT